MIIEEGLQEEVRVLRHHGLIKSYGGHYSPTIDYTVFVDNQNLEEGRAGGNKRI